uniref:Uncharacterized protein n=1 Tax=Anguilla anguilla TaxID=7936 RepID=A0A0E9UJS8_ANGAN
MLSLSLIIFSESRLKD